jgi:hypothetical protein
LQQEGQMIGVVGGTSPGDLLALVVHGRQLESLELNIFILRRSGRDRPGSNS